MFKIYSDIKIEKNFTFCIVTNNYRSSYHILLYYTYQILFFCFDCRKMSPSLKQSCFYFVLFFLLCVNIFQKKKVVMTFFFFFFQLWLKQIVWLLSYLWIIILGMSIFGNFSKFNKTNIKRLIVFFRKLQLLYERVTVLI